MSDAGLLIVSAFCDWPHYDLHGNLLGDTRPGFAVFAIRPEPGAISDRFLDYLSCDPGDDRLDPAWYLRLQPDNAPDIVEVVKLQSPLNDPGRSVQFVVLLKPLPGEYVVATIDERGEQVPTQPIVSNGYKYNQNLSEDDPHKVALPPPGAFKLVPMTIADVTPGSAYSCPDAGDGRDSDKPTVVRN
jgi:hypothetical protein